MSGLKGLFQQLFEDKPAGDEQGSNTQRTALAAAVLMTEVAHADFEVDDAEKRTLLNALTAGFGVSDTEARELADEAERLTSESASMHGYLRTINDALSYKEKLGVLEMLWKIAYADGVLDKHEEALMRRLGELLNVPHRDWIQLKLKIAGE